MNTQRRRGVGHAVRAAAVMLALALVMGVPVVHAAGSVGPRSTSGHRALLQEQSPPPPDGQTTGPPPGPQDVSSPPPTSAAPPPPATSGVAGAQPPPQPQPSPPPSSSSSNDGTSGTTLSSGAIAGIVIGTLVASALVVVGVGVVCYQRRKELLHVPVVTEAGRPQGEDEGAKPSQYAMPSLAELYALAGRGGGGGGSAEAPTTAATSASTGGGSGGAEAAHGRAKPHTAYSS